MTGNSDYARVARAITYLEAHAAEQPGLAAVAAHVGLSAFHFQRLFHRWAGVTPKDFLQTLTLQRAKRLLADSRSVFDASLEVGLSGPSRLHDLFVNLETMTPGEFRRGAAGVRIAWGIHPTPFGEALVAATERGVCGFSFLGHGGGRGPRGEAVASLRARWPRAELRVDTAATAPFAAEVSARMRGEPGQPLALLLRGSPLQIRVWRALLAVPEGKVCTYQGLARMAGVPGAARAVGTALATNPVGYLIPCHRVVRASGAVGDYQWEATRKRALLAVEATRLAVPSGRVGVRPQARSTRQL